MKMNAEIWNNKYNIGTKVNVEMDTGTPFHTKTRSDAWTLGDGTSVILLEGIRGSYALNRVKTSEKYFPSRWICPQCGEVNNIKVKKNIKL